MKSHRDDVENFVFPTNCSVPTNLMMLQENEQKIKKHRTFNVVKRKLNFDAIFATFHFNGKCFAIINSIFFKIQDRNFLFH